MAKKVTITIEGGNAAWGWESEATRMLAAASRAACSRLLNIGERVELSNKWGRTLGSIVVEIEEVPGKKEE